MSQEQNDSSKLLWGLVTTLLVLIGVGLGGYQWWENSQPSSLAEELSVPSKSAEPAAPAPVEVKPVDALPVHQDMAAPKTLVDDSILAQTVPENESLAKEELAKLDDIQNQLNDQEKLLKTQHQTADQIIKEKEAQLALLEKQLTEFEPTP